MYIHQPDRNLFSFAGLWDEWRSPDGEVIRTCTIVTTAANNTMSPVHDRMPVIVRPELESLWLNPDEKEFSKLLPVLEPLRDDELQMYQVSPRVNSPASDIPELIEPVPQQTSLF
jgi:putative SOS response-associated peptidase YedK